MEICLFKLNKNSQTQSWQIEVVGSKYRTKEGLVGGKITISNWTQCTAKNIGKANEISPEEQAILEASAKAKKKEEQGYYKSIEDAGKGKKFLEPMLAHKYQDNKKLVDSNVTNYYCQPKLDGIRNVHSKDGSWSRKGKKFLCIPHIEKEADKLLSYLSKHYNVIALDGELYNHKLKADFEKITSLVRKTKVTEEDLAASEEYMQYHIYDIIIKGLPFSKRQSILRKAFSKFDFKYLIRVNTHKIKSMKDMDDYYDHYLKAGYEGQMLRLSNSFYENCRTKSLLKRKEFQDKEAVVLLIQSGVGNADGLAATALCKWPDNDIEFSATIMGTKEYREKLLEESDNICGSIATIRFQNLTKDGKPRFPRLVTIRDYE